MEGKMGHFSEIIKLQFGKNTTHSYVFSNYCWLVFSEKGVVTRSAFSTYSGPPSQRPRRGTGWGGGGALAPPPTFWMLKKYILFYFILFYFT